MVASILAMTCHCFVAVLDAAEPNGASCNYNSDCASDWCCAGGEPYCGGYDGGECAAKVGPGETCCFDAQCYGGSCSAQCNGGNTPHCVCTDEMLYVTGVKAAGSPTVKATPAWNLTECCNAAAQVVDGPNGTTCGWGEGTQVKWTHSQTVSWSETITATESITFKESLVVEGLEASISLSGSYTKDSSRTETLEQAISSPCTGTYTENIFLNFYSSAQIYEVPVTLTYTQCGETGTTAGTVTSTVFNGQYVCSPHKCQTSCSPSQGCDHTSALRGLK